MSLFSPFTRKLSILFRRNRYRSELDEEMEFHRAQAAKELEAGGMSAEKARSAARRQFGNETRLREKSHEVVGFRVETVVQDLRFATRQLRKNPGYACVAIMILALGMGVSVAIFGFVDAALLEPLPYVHPDRLMSVDEASALLPRSNLSYDDYQDWKRMNKSFSSLDVYTGMGYLLQTPSGIVPVPARRVSDGFFSTLGVKMMLGRGFLPGEDQQGKPKIVILTYGTWLKRYGGRNDVVGQSLNLSGENYTIVGVLPQEFNFAPARDSEFWVPLLGKNGCEARRSCHNLDGVGRLRDGVTHTSGSRRDESDRGAIGEAVSGVESWTDYEHDVAFRAACGSSSACAAHSAGRRSLAASDCVRECGQLVACALRSTQARDCGARRTRGNAGATHAAVCY